MSAYRLPLAGYQYAKPMWADGNLVLSLGRKADQNYQELAPGWASDQWK